MISILLAIGGLLVVVLLATRVMLPRCAHLDDDGHSALYWHRDGTGGRLCGWCPHCGRLTRGWRTDGMPDTPPQWLGAYPPAPPNTKFRKGG